MSVSKIVAAAASGVGGAGPDIDEVFSTYLYEGTGGALTVNNGIDLSGEGGLVWTKNRGDSRNHVLFDTERPNGEDYSLFTNGTDAESENSAFNFVPTSTGYTFNNNDDTNKSGFDFVGWTFRKAPKFFDIVTWSGNSTAGRTVSHNLGSVPGCIFVKSITDGSEDWCVYHRGIASDAETDSLFLNATDAALDNDAFWNDTAPTSTEFTLGTSTKTNRTGHNFVAYLFAHNDGDGGFGPDGDADVIKCGNYTAVSAGTEIDIGFEPQWIMIKKSSGPESWYIYDAMRGVVTGGGSSRDKKLRANSSGAEAAVNAPIIAFSAKGFVLESTDNEINGSGGTYIYTAIRRGPLAAPEAGTDVFDLATYTGSGADGRILTNSTVADAVFSFYRGAGFERYVYDRQRGDEQALSIPASGAETNSLGGSTGRGFNLTKHQTNLHLGLDDSNWFNINGEAYGFFALSRAPNFFDVVAYTGNSTAGRTVSHNLDVVPEMMWIKSRSHARSWRVYHSSFTNGSVSLNSAASKDTSTNYFSTPTADNIILGSDNDTNRAAYTYIAYLFASLDGVSKVGSYTGTGSTQTIDCGFSGGARFVLIKCTNDTENWIVFDSERGIVSGNDPYFSLNTTDAENTSSDFIDPASSGFIVNSNAGEINNSNNTYIFYAIA